MCSWNSIPGIHHQLCWCVYVGRSLGQRTSHFQNNSNLCQKSTSFPPSILVHCLVRSSTSTFPRMSVQPYVLLVLLGYLFTQSSLWRNTFAKMEQAARPLTSAWLVLLLLLVSTYSLARYSSGGTGLGSIQWQYPKGGRCSCFLLHSSWVCLCMLPLSFLCLNCSLSIRNSQTGMLKLGDSSLDDRAE